MESKTFTVTRIDGDYAWLQESGTQNEPVFIARALLPEGIDEGSRLLFQDFTFSLA